MIFKNRELAKEKAKSIRVLLCDNDGTLTPGHTFYSAKGEELKMYSHIDGRGVYLLKQNGIDFGILTGENSPIVSQRASKLNIDIVILGANDKVKELDTLLKMKNLKPCQIAYIGDDTNDCQISQYVGLSAAVANGHPALLQIVDIICTLTGGNGAVREFIDFIIEENQI